MPSIQFAILAALLCGGGGAWTQSAQDTPLGDVARNIREAKVTTKPAEVLVDNDNFSKIMQEAESRRMASLAPQLSLDLGQSPTASFGSPDIACRLSYNAHGLKLSERFSGGPQVVATKEIPKIEPTKEEKAKEKDSGAANIPPAELGKLEGPAAIVRDSLQLSVYNGSDWNIEEITVGLTILRRRSATARVYSGTGTVPPSLAPAKLIPASVVQTGSVQIVAKRSDTTILYHFKGIAAPNSKATFQQPLGLTLGPDQEWHWASVEAKGTPPKK